MIWNAVNIISFELSLLKYFKSPNATILDFGIVETFKNNDIHIESHFLNLFLKLLVWKCLT